MEEMTLEQALKIIEEQKQEIQGLHNVRASIINLTFDEGYDEGYKAGYEVGYNHGFDDGWLGR